MLQRTFGALLFALISVCASSGFGQGPLPAPGPVPSTGPRLPPPATRGTPELGNLDEVVDPNVVPFDTRVPTALPFHCWIVSSRGCKHRDGRCGIECLEFYRYQGGRSLQRVDGAAFFTSIDPRRPLCIFCHGGYYRFSDIVEESAPLDRWMRGATKDACPQVVFFTWPSSRLIPVVPIDVMTISHRTAFDGLLLAKLINRLPTSMRVTLMGHSFGGRTLSSALHVIGGGTLQELPNFPNEPLVPRRMRAVYLSPAIDHHWLNPGERYGLAVTVCDRVLILRNSLDPVLPLYPLRRPFGQRALGHDGLGNSDRAALGQWNTIIQDIDAACVLGVTHNLNKFYREPQLSALIAPYVTFAE